MSKLDEIRNKLKKDLGTESFLNPNSANQKKSNDASQSKDVDISDVSFEEIDDASSIVFQAHKRAIFIGNNAYENCNPLDKCVNDARSMQHIFSKIGYRLVYDFDLTSEKMYKLFDRFKEDIEEGDELVVNFSGHGIQINSEIYLVPVDAPPPPVHPLELIDVCINLDKEMDEMLARGAKMVVAIVDACRNQLRIDYQNLAQDAYVAGVTDAIKMSEVEAVDSAKNMAQPNLITGPLTKSYSAQGKAILFATSHDTSALEYRDLSNGVFTYFFLKEVVKPGRTITEVIERVRGLVSEYTEGQQVPAFHNNLPGDYYFVNKK
jgi:Caspase domain